jgi:uncharacterized membrane protein (UPF0127 family)
MMRRRLRAAAGVVLVAVLLGACGSADGSSNGEGSTTTSAPTSAPLTAGSSSDEEATTLPPVDGPFAEGRTPIPGFAEVEVRIVEGPDGEPIIICVLVADTPAQRARGLMEVTDLGGYDGMLFRFETESANGFWMKDTVLPLSIAYLDADGAVVSTADMDPCPEGTARCPSYPAEAPYRMALEVEQGGLAPLGLTGGGSARLEVTGPCAPLSPET